MIDNLEFVLLMAVPRIQRIGFHEVKCAHYAYPVLLIPLNLFIDFRLVLEETSVLEKIIEFSEHDL